MPRKRALACHPTVCMCVCLDLLFKDLITHSGGVPPHNAGCWDCGMGKQVYNHLAAPAHSSVCLLLLYIDMHLCVCLTEG